jgi:hypothetical protein
MGEEHQWKKVRAGPDVATLSASEVSKLSEAALRVYCIVQVIIYSA